MFGNLPGIVIVLAWLRRYDWKRRGADDEVATLRLKTAIMIARLRSIFDLRQQQILPAPVRDGCQAGSGHIPAFPTSNWLTILLFSVN